MLAFLPDLPMVLRPVVFLACGIGVVWLFCRGSLARNALRTVLRNPALLVPAAMTLAGIVATVVLTHDSDVRDHPWPSPYAGFASWLRPSSWPGTLLVTAGIAGQIGLLEGLAVDRRPSGFGMLGGIRRHFGTVLVAKLLLGTALVWLSGAVDMRSAGQILFVLPNLFLAPLIGTASLHPGQPLAALRASFDVATRHVFAVGWPVLFEGLALAALFVVTGKFGLWIEDHDELLAKASVLSFNHTPFLQLRGFGWIASIAMALGVFVSAVFVTAHWHGATQGYRVPRGKAARRAAA